MVKDKFILNLCIFGCVINALVVPFNSLQAPYVDQVLHAGSEATSIMSASIVLSMAIGMLFIPKLKEKMGGRILFVVGGVIMGGTYCILSLIGNMPSYLVYLALCLDTLLMGIGVVLINFPLQVSMLKRVPQEYLGRVAALFNALALCSVPVTSCIIGFISEVLSIERLFSTFGLFVAVLFVSQVLNKNIKEFDKY